MMRSKGAPIIDLAPPAGHDPRSAADIAGFAQCGQHRPLDLAPDNSDLAARIASYELAYKMQRHAPEAVDIAQETEATQKMYGLDNPRTEDFGKRCLYARRLVERGVRFIQLYSGGNHNDNNWDAHGDLEKNHNYHAGNTDQPIAALLKDLKQRGLLDETLVVWGGEFGRQPTAEYAKGTGRDHNCLRLHDVDGRRRHQGRPRASARPTNSAHAPSKTRCTSNACTPRSCTNSAWTPTA